MSKAIALTSDGQASLPAVGSGGGSGAAVQGRPKMKKATLSLYDSVPAGGGAKPGGLRGSIDFQFNPKEVTIQKAAKWERQSAKRANKAAPPEFNGPEPCKLTVEMFFDATERDGGSVVPAVESLFACCVPTDESAGNKKPSPPLVVLQWGSISSFPAFVTSVSAKYTLFRGDGTPVRALCSVAMEEMPGEPVGQNPTSGGRTVRRVHRTIAGDSLSSVAFAEYGDPARWRALAAFNGIDDPLRMRTGTVLMVPSPEELEASR